MRKTKTPLSVFVLQAKKRQDKKRGRSVMSKGSCTFKLAQPLPLGPLWASGGGDPLRPLALPLQAEEAGGSINGDENCPGSFLMSPCFKEKTVSQTQGRGKHRIPS